MYPHRIRLRGPWTCEPLFRLDQHGVRTTMDLPAPRRITMPTHWPESGLQDFRGGLRLIRPFGYPGRIDAAERVWLTVEDSPGPARATLNGMQLGAWDGAAEFEITSLLKSRNTLVIDVETPACAGTLWGEVALEVRATAYLKDVALRLAKASSPQLIATGQIAGSAERPLDLYLFAAAEFLAHGMAQAGQYFSLSAELPAAAGSTQLPVRIELVDVATIWYVVERMVHVEQSNEPGNSSLR
jgi:hypothetical protein